MIGGRQLYASKDEGAFARMYGAHVTSRPACVTDYEHLYARGYYAHAAGATSFDLARLPTLVADDAVRLGGVVVDLGGGNGELGRALNDHGVRSITIDAADREGSDYIRLDLSRYDPSDAEAVRRRIAARLGETYLATCFDVAEHIDIEHLGQFLLNIAALIENECLISISTRPSSAANRYHSSVLPISTWRRLFALVGFSSERHEGLQTLRSEHRFRSADANLIAVSHWQRVDPFRESSYSHQHYLRLTRTSRTLASAVEVAERVDELVDIGYRRRKRKDVVCPELPILTYHVNFIQDWSFARSLMDVWPSERFRAIVRSDLVAEPYRHMLQAVLERTGCRHMVASTTAQAADGVEAWGDLAGSLVVTATEGVPSITHLLGSLLMLELERRGGRTLCLQHGMTVLRSMTPAAATFGAWSEGSAKVFQEESLQAVGLDVDCTGSPKFLDALLPSSDGALHHRLGVDPSAYQKSVLIGLNLHWSVHRHGVPETYQWLQRLCLENEDILFIIRPHPDDSTIYEAFDILRHRNVMLVDEMLMLSLDWPIGRLLRAVDGVITTYSTLAIEAVAASKPVALLPTQDFIRSSQFLPASTPWSQVGHFLPVVEESEWLRGKLPACLNNCDSLRWLTTSDWFAPSRNAIDRIAAVVSRRGRSVREDRVSCIASAFAQASSHLCLDTNPHRDRARIQRAISLFVA